MRPRTVAQFIKDKRVSQAAQYDYRHASRELVIEAQKARERGDRDEAIRCEAYAFIAGNAARVEFFDPEPVGNRVHPR